MSDMSQISVLASTVKVCTSEIRDVFPDDLPYLWEKLAPIIENIEGCATSIKQIVRESHTR